jgi:hypothetical protein
MNKGQVIRMAIAIVMAAMFAMAFAVEGQNPQSKPDPIPPVPLVEKGKILASASSTRLASAVANFSSGKEPVQLNAGGAQDFDFILPPNMQQVYNAAMAALPENIRQDPARPAFLLGVEDDIIVGQGEALDMYLLGYVWYRDTDVSLYVKGDPGYDQELAAHTDKPPRDATLTAAKSK